MSSNICLKCLTPCDRLFTFDTKEIPESMYAWGGAFCYCETCHPAKKGAIEVTFGDGTYCPQIMAYLNRADWIDALFEKMKDRQ